MLHQPGPLFDRLLAALRVDYELENHRVPLQPGHAVAEPDARPYPQIGRRAVLPQGSPLPISVITMSAYRVPGYTSKSVNLSR